MKKSVIILFSAITLFTASVASAQWVNVNVSCQVNRVQAVCSFQNSASRPVACRGRVAGRTVSGHVVWANVNTYVPGLSYGTAYVYTNAMNPFVFANGQVQCRF